MFRGGPLNRKTREHGPGRWPAFRDAAGDPVRIERAQHRFRVVGEIYCLMLDPAPASYPPGSRVYRWQPARVPDIPGSVPAVGARS